VITPVTEIRNPLETVRSEDEIIGAGTVQIRSYTQYTFDKAPPFRFILAPGTVGIGAKLRFMLGKKGGQWLKVEPTITSTPGGCVEVKVDGSVNGSGSWEVQVERL
jgi:hypothetical protein